MLNRSILIGLLLMLESVFCAITSKRLLSHTIEGTCMQGSAFVDDSDGRKLHMGRDPYQYTYDDLGGEDVLNSDLKKITFSYWRFKYSNKHTPSKQNVWQMIDTDGADPSVRSGRILTMQQHQLTDGGQLISTFKHGDGDWEYQFNSPNDDEQWVYEVASIDIEAEQFRVYRLYSDDQSEDNASYSLSVFSDDAVGFASENLYLNIATDYQTSLSDYTFCGKIRTFDVFFGLYIGDLSNRHFYTGLANQGEFDMMKILHIGTIPKYESIVYIEDSSKYNGLIELKEGVTVDQDKMALKFSEGTQIQLLRPFQIGHQYSTRVQSDYHLSAVFSFWIFIQPQVKQAEIYRKLNEEGTHIFSFGFLQNDDLKYELYINWLEANASQKTHTVPTAYFEMLSGQWNRVTLTFNSEYPTYEFRYTLVLGDNDVKLTIEPDTQLTKFTLGNPRLFDQNHSRFQDYLGNKDVSNFLAESYFLKDFGVYAGSTILISPQAEEVIENCAQAIRIESDLGEFSCLMCKAGYAALQDGACYNSCPEGQVMNTDTRTCDSDVVCAPKCATCEPSDPSKCITCAGNRVDGVDRDVPGNEDINPACTCPTGYFEAVDEQPNCVKFIHNSKTSTGYFEYSLRVITYATLATSNPGEGDRELVQDVYFDIEFEEIPEVVVGFLNYELTDSTSIEPGFKIEVTEVFLTHFTATLTMKEGCKMKQISFSYFANGDFFTYKTGGFLWNTDESTDLSTGTDDRDYVKTFSITGWQGNLAASVMLYMNALTLTDGSKDLSYGCTIDGDVTQNGSNVNFKIAYNAYNGALIDELGCGYIVYPQDFGLSPGEEEVFSDSEDYVRTQHQQNPFKAIHQRVVTQPAITMESDLYFASLQYATGDNMSSPPDSGASIPFGVQFGPRLTDSKYEIQYVTGYNAGFSYMASMFVPQKNCDYVCDTCLLFDSGFGPCKQCNMEVADNDDNRSPIAPYCGCKDGYYDNISNRICTPCQTNCLTCKYQADNCIECAANRVNFPACDCSDAEHRFDSINTPPFYSPWCSTCQICVPKVTISDDYENLKILFDYEIAFDDLPVHIDQYTHSFEICDILFGVEVIQLLGRGPLCAMNSNDDGLEVILGGRPPIFPGDLVYFEPNVLRVKHEDCDGKTLDDVYDGYLQFLGTIEVPEIEISYPTEPVSTCEDIVIQIESIKKDFNKGLKSTTWSFSSIDPAPNFTKDLELKAYIASFKNKNNLKFPAGYLDIFTTYRIELEFETYIGQTKVENFEFSTKDAVNDLSLKFETRDYAELYVWQNITLTTNFFYVNCKTGINETPEVGVTVWEQLDSLEQNITSNAIYELKVNKTQQAQLAIPPYVAEPLRSYQVQFTITAFDITKSVIQTLTFKESNLVAFIKGGDRNHAISEPLDIELYIDDPDFDPNEDQTYATLLSWSCNEDTLDGERCQKFDLTGDLIDTSAVENTFAFTIDEYQLHLYKLYFIQYDLSKYHRVNKGQVLIIGSDVSIPSLDVAFPRQYYYPTNGIAMNSDIFCDLSPYTLTEEEIKQGVKPEDLKYSVTIVYENAIKATIKFEKALTKFKLWEHFTDIRKTNIVELRYQVYNPLYLNPFQEKVQIKVNSPPFNCKITINPSNSYSLDTVFNISVDKCLDLDDYASQLVFRYFVYINSQDVNEEKINAKETKAIILSEKTKQNYLNTYLPQGNEINDYNILVMVQVEDSLGSLTNFTRPVQVNENLAASESIMLDKIKAKIDSLSGTLEQKVGHLGFLAREMNSNTLLVDTVDEVAIQQIINVKRQLVYELRNLLNEENFDADEQILNIIYNLFETNSFVNHVYQQETVQLLNQMFDIMTAMKITGDSYSFDSSRTQKQTNNLDTFKRISYKMMQIVDILFKTVADPTINPNVGSYQPPVLDEHGKFVRVIPGEEENEDQQQTRRILYLPIDGEYVDGEQIIVDGENGEQEEQEKYQGEITKMIAEKLYTLIQFIPKILCFDQYPNDEARNYSGKSFTSVNQKVDRYNLNKNYLQVSRTGSPYQGGPTLLDDGFYEDDDGVYLVSFRVFKYNPFKFDTNLFPWTKHNTFLDPYIQEIRPGFDMEGEDFTRINIDTRISHLFEYKPSEIESKLICVTMEKGYGGANVFVNSTCTQNLIQSQDGSKFYANCLCNTLSLATLIDDVEQVFNPYIEPVGIDGEEEQQQVIVAQGGTTFLQWAVFWLFLFFTMLWLLLSLQGYHTDKMQDDFFITSEDYRQYIKKLKAAEKRNAEINQVKPINEKVKKENGVASGEEAFVPLEKVKQNEDDQQQYSQNTPSHMIKNQFVPKNMIQEEEEDVDSPKIKNDKNIDLNINPNYDDEERKLASRSSRRTASSQSSRSKFSLEPDKKFEPHHFNNQNGNGNGNGDFPQFNNLQLETNQGSPGSQHDVDEDNEFKNVGQLQLSSLQNKYKYLESMKKNKEDIEQVDDNFKKLWWSYIPKVAQDEYADEDEKKKLTSQQPIREIVPPPQQTTALEKFLRSKVRGLVYFHRYTSPIALYDNHVKRPKRITLIYFNMILYFMLTGVLANAGFHYWVIFAISLALYVAVGIFDNLVVMLLNMENFLVKTLTFIILMIIIFTFIIIGIDSARLIHDDEISDWGIGYTLTIINEFFVMGLIDAISAFSLFKWAIKKQDEPNGAKAMTIIKGYLVIDNINSFSQEGIEEQLQKQQQQMLQQQQL